MCGICQNCGKNEGQDSHLCPYAQDINNDQESLCNCCEDCECGCVGEI